MKKRILALAMCLLLCLSLVLASCGDDKPCEKCVDENKDAVCDVCGQKVDCEKCVDANKDALCDVCGKEVACEAHADADKDGICDVCKKDIPSCATHADADSDFVCDVCADKLPLPVASEISGIKFGDYETTSPYTSATAFAYKGEKMSLTDGILVTSERVPIINVSGRDIVYRAYNVLTGKEVFSITDSFIVASGNKEIDRVSISTEKLPEGFFGVWVCYDGIYGGDYDDYYDFDFDLTIYDYEGNKKLQWSDSYNGEYYGIEDYMTPTTIAIPGAPKDFLVLDDKLYTIDEAKFDLTLAGDMNLLGITYDEIENFIYKDGKYITNRGNTLSVYNDKFVFEKKIEIDIDYTYYDDYEYYVLSNLNIFVHYYGSHRVSDMLEGDTPDYITCGYVNYYGYSIIDWKTGNVTELPDLPVYISEIRPLKLFNNTEDSDITYSFENLVYGKKFVDGHPTEIDVVYAMNNDGTIVSEITPLLGEYSSNSVYVSALPNGNVLLQNYNNSEEYVCKADGTIIGRMPKYDERNDKWIIIDDVLYDYNLNKVYEIPKDYDIYRITDNEVYLRTEVVLDKGMLTERTVYRFYVYTSAGLSNMIFEDVSLDALEVNNGAYVKTTYNQSTGHKKMEVVSANGTTIGTYTDTRKDEYNYENYSLVQEHDGYLTILKTTGNGSAETGTQVTYTLIVIK